MIPVVLHHGLFGTGNVKVGPVTVRYFRGIEHAIAARGHPVVVTRVHPSCPLEMRARQLKEDLLRRLKIIGCENDRVILVGHSMGGLDARYAVAKLGLADHVAAVVTVSTPHRGSPAADWIVRHVGEGLKVGPLLHSIGIEMRAIIDVTTWKCAEFNQTVLDVPGVAYFSVSASRPWTRVPPFALHSYYLVARAEGENDGLVSVSSAQWRTHLATWPADHWQTIGRRMIPGLVNPRWSIVPYWMGLMDTVVASLDNAATARVRGVVATPGVLSGGSF